MLTFGDLLTLLLCFFVVGLSQDLRSKASDISTLDDRAPTVGENSQIGTALAHLVGEDQVGSGAARGQGGQSVTELRFTSADMLPDAGLLPEAVQRVRGMYRELGKQEALVVSGCSQSEDEQPGALERRLVRQFADAGMWGSKLRFSLPQRCDGETVLTVRR